jgi:hypothetical protein
MNIEQLSTGLSRQRIQEQAAIQVESMIVQEAKDQSEALMKLMDTAEAVTDPDLGSRVNILA